MSARRLELAGVAVLAVAAVALFLAAPTYPNYDSYYHLVWGRELLDGVKPSFEAYQAPTEHPLWVALAAVLGVVLGGEADRALVLAGVLSLVALVWGVYRLGAAVLGRWPGLAAAAFAGSSFAFLLYAVRAYVDVPFLAVVVWAGVLEAENVFGNPSRTRGRPRTLRGYGPVGNPPWRCHAGFPPRPSRSVLNRPGHTQSSQTRSEGPRRGARAMALLAVAGLLRPEAWVLAGLYWLWRAPAADARERAWLAVLAAAGPLLWAATDLAVTGDPLFSLHSTSDLADELGRDRGLGAVPGSFASFLADTVRPPVALLGLAGAALAWRRLGPRALAVPLALFGAGAATFVGTGLAGLSILPRYLTVPAVALCLFAGYGLMGFTTLEPGCAARRRWARAAGAAGAAGLAFAALQAPSLGRLATELRFIRGTHEDLSALLASAPVRHGLRCGPLTFPNYRLVPDARWLLDLPRERVGARSARRRAHGVAVFVLGSSALRRFGFAAGASPSTNAPDPGFIPAARRGRFSAYVSCPGG